MKRPDDSSLDHQQLSTVKLHADRLLREAGAYGRFPTPIKDLVGAAKLVIVDDETLNASFLERFAKKAKAGIATIKSALRKVLGVFDSVGRLVLIDKSTPKPKVPFVTLHEVGHGSLPHQSQVYRLLHDCEHTLDPDIGDLFEREANVFASEALFQCETLQAEYNQAAQSVKTAMALAKRVGSSNYAAFRWYVTKNAKACCLIVLEPTTTTLDGREHRSVRRVVANTSFALMHNMADLEFPVDGSSPLAAALPRSGKRMAFEREVILTDRNGDEHLCLAESFDTTHQLLVLLWDAGALTSTSVLIARPW